MQDPTPQPPAWGTTCLSGGYDSVEADTCTHGRRRGIARITGLRGLKIRSPRPTEPGQSSRTSSRSSSDPCNPIIRVIPLVVVCCRVRAWRPPERNAPRKQGVLLDACISVPCFDGGITCEVDPDFLEHVRREAREQSRKRGLARPQAAGRGRACTRFRRRGMTESDEKVF